MNIREADIWKYVADTTISEVVHKGQENCIQKVVDDGKERKARDDGFEMQRAQDQLRKEPARV